MKLSLIRDWTPSLSCPAWWQTTQRSPPLDTWLSLVSWSASSGPWLIGIVIALCKLMHMEFGRCEPLESRSRTDLLVHLNKSQRDLADPPRNLCAVRRQLLLLPPRSFSTILRDCVGTARVFDQDIMMFYPGLCASWEKTHLELGKACSALCISTKMK